jgi:hypothetical protein
LRKSWNGIAGTESLGTHAAGDGDDLAWILGDPWAFMTTQTLMQSLTSPVFDISGFAFGDQHGAKRTVHFAEDLAAARRAGKKIILLPQALGPFEEPKIRDAFARIVDACDRLYTRDRISLEHARNAAGNGQRIRLAPDFTNLVKCPPTVAANGGRRACIVPNQRMIEHAKNQKAADGYLRMLHHCIAAAREAGLEF